jgi:hypothetical protein
MGRGRQKAKHTKVARELKYFSPEVDLTALERELGHADENELVDKWADLFPDAGDDVDSKQTDDAADATAESEASAEATGAESASDSGSADA